MFGLFFDVLSVVVGVFLPIYRTWKVLKSRKSKPLIPFAKYWMVYGTLTSFDTIASALNISCIIPGYSLIKFVIIVYICFGHEQIYQKLISPFIMKYEPTQERLVSLVYQFASKVLLSCIAKYQDTASEESVSAESVTED